MSGEAGPLIPLGRLYTTPGFSDKLVHVFVAMDLREVGQSLEADQRLTVHPVDAARV